LSDLDPYPLLLLALGIVTIFVLILRLKVNAFLALIGAALLVAVLSPRVVYEAGKDGLSLNLVRAPTLVATGFGATMGKIGIAIALATIVGKALMDSGAADRIVRFFTGLFGESRAALALLLSGFVLSVPVFFDTVFFLLVPLAKALYLRTGRNYLLYLMAICAGGAITHSLVPPTPGPIAMAANLKVDLGMTILAGVLIGAPLAFLGYLYGAWINRRRPVKLRHAGTESLEELEQTAHKPEAELPSLFASFLPILLPVILITAATFFGALARRYPDLEGGFRAGSVRVTPGSILDFLGQPAVALLLSAIVAMIVVARRRHLSRAALGTFTAAALDEAGMILLITSAGGAFGSVLAEVGVGDSLDTLARHLGIAPLVVAWAVAVLFKLAQGSGTVSMLTTSGIVFGILSKALQDQHLPVTPENMADYLGYHPVYLVMVIGAGSVVGSWMNDSGYWIVCRMGGLTEAETLKSWTVTLAIMGIAGLPFIWVLTRLVPFV
jgi:gluconate:H+ symporter, GntP family